MYCTFGVDNTGNGTVDAVASHVAHAWATGFRASSQSDQVRPAFAFAQLGTEAGDTVVAQAAVGINGGDSRTLAPQNCAMLARKLTNLGGRKNSGRMFLPWVFEQEVDNTGVMDPNAVTKFSTDLNNFLLALADVAVNGPTPMVILHNEDIHGVTIPPTSVAGLVLDHVIATQRRRMRH